MNDAIRKFYKRRQMRLQKKSLKLDSNNRLPYGLADRAGIDTEGMSPREVWEALEEKGTDMETAFKNAKAGKQKTGRKKNYEISKLDINAVLDIAKEKEPERPPSPSASIHHQKVYRGEGEPQEVWSVKLMADGTEERFETEKDGIEYLKAKGYRPVKNKLGMEEYKNAKLQADENAWSEKCSEIKDARQEFSRLAEKYLDERYPKVYVRFGRIPEGGKSKNYQTGKLEDGVSVFEAYKIGRKYAVKVGASMFLYRGYDNKGKQMYEVEGEKIGSGSDDEPLLTNVSIKKKIKSENHMSARDFVYQNIDNLK